MRDLICQHLAEFNIVRATLPTGITPFQAWEIARPAAADFEPEQLLAEAAKHGRVEIDGGRLNAYVFREEDLLAFARSILAPRGVL